MEQPINSIRKFIENQMEFGVTLKKALAKIDLKYFQYNVLRDRPEDQLKVKVINKIKEVEEAERNK